MKITYKQQQALKQVYELGIRHILKYLQSHEIEREELISELRDYFKLTDQKSPQDTDQYLRH